jgi:hypothetical protein
LPKIKLKINSNQNSNQDSKSSNLQSNIVKPLKINLSNKNDDNLKSSEKKPNILNKNSAANYDEIELGEVVRPEKLNKTKIQKDLNLNTKNNIPNHQNDNILKL